MVHIIEIIITRMIVRYIFIVVGRGCRKLDDNNGHKRKRKSVSIIVIIIVCLVAYENGGDSILIYIMMPLAE